MRAFDKLFSIKDKVIIVTGASGGIGKSLYNALKSNGAKVIGFARGGPVKVDLTKQAGRTTAIDYIRKQTKTVDALVNCMGTNTLSWDDTLDTNLTAIYKFINLVIPLMPSGSSIVNVTSINSFQAFPNNPQYVASKGGLKMLTKALALDLGSCNIRVNNLCPGYIHTNMTHESYINEEAHKKRLNRIILNRWGDPKDLIGPTIFLISDASSYVTGIDLVVDGGWLIKGI